MNVKAAAHDRVWKAHKTNSDSFSGKLINQGIDKLLEGPTTDASLKGGAHQ
jgi:hypothetical protein